MHLPKSIAKDRSSNINLNERIPDKWKKWCYKRVTQKIKHKQYPFSSYKKLIKQQTFMTFLLTIVDQAWRGSVS